MIVYAHNCSIWERQETFKCKVSLDYINLVSKVLKKRDYKRWKRWRVV